jgi:hypothetical protein
MELARAALAAAGSVALAPTAPTTSPPARPKISCLDMTTTISNIKKASAATPIEDTTSSRLPATTPVASSPIATSTTDRTTPNRITLELRSKA